MGAYHPPANPGEELLLQGGQVRLPHQHRQPRDLGQGAGEVGGCTGPYRGTRECRRVQESVWRVKEGAGGCWRML